MNFYMNFEFDFDIVYCNVLVVEYFGMIFDDNLNI